MIKTADIVGQSVPYLYNAAYFHDIGKLLTQTVDDKGIGHYYNHENVGAYIYLTYVNPTYDGLLPALLINWHMRPSIWEKSESCKENDRQMFGDVRFEELQILHEADEEAK
jgi:CRISPR/Cas system-associated endonuclease Cas3-HD